MPITRITTSATTQLKNGPGRINAISCPNAGTTWALTINDGPTLGPGSGGTGAGNAFLPIGGAAVLTTGIVVIYPIFFNGGCQIVTSGASPGELDIDWA